MTTEVTVKMTHDTNISDIMVDVLNGEGEVTQSHRVSDGEDVSLYVYDSQELAVREVEKVSDTEEGETAAAEV